jgi:hypothetical protein
VITTEDRPDAPAAAGAPVDVEADAPAEAEGDAGSAGPGSHVLVRFARAVDATFDKVAGAPAWSMSEPEQRETLVLLERAEARLAEVRLRVLAAADRNQVGAADGATSTAAWLAHQTRATRARCARQVRLALALDERFEATRRALATGRLSVEQAHVVVAAVDRLTDEHDDLPPGTHARAEAHLLDLAGTCDARVLHALGKRLFEVVCPQAADAEEGRTLAEEEERAARTATLSMRENGDGTVEGRFKLPTLHAQLLKKALEALTSPRRLGDGRRDPATGCVLPYPMLLGQGFMQLLEHHLAVDKLPAQGRSPFTVVVRIGLDALQTGLGIATLDTGARISAGETRRLACRAGIIPLVLGGPSHPLDLGHEDRLFTTAQRLALAEIHDGCATLGCDRPAAWAEIHHKNPWSQGGRTNLANGLPLCPPHHHMADHPGKWTMHELPHGGVRFTRRQ